MAENETQATQTEEEVTEAVETQSPATEKGIEVSPTQTTEEATEVKAEDTTEAKAADATEAKAADATEAKAEDATEAKAEDATEAKAEETPAEPEEEEEISYHAVEKEGEITAIWEMQGARHIRTISARSGEGQKILSLFTSEIHETDSPSMGESMEEVAA